MKWKTIEEIEQRRAEIKTEMDKDGADLDALEKEVRELSEAEKELRKNAKSDAEKRRLIANGLGTVSEIHKEEEHRTMEEIRNSKEYINAYAEYIKSGDDKECRALLSTNATSATGYVPVPELVDQIVRHAWENEEILKRVRKTNFRGNLKVAFELSADGAYVHNEGTSAPTEEALTLGIVTMIPSNIKKWIRISDEAVAMGGEAFLRYVYEELTYQIAHKMAAEVVTTIAGLSTTNSSTAVGAKAVSSAPSLTVIGQAFANLSDEATDNVIIMNKLTYVNFKAAYAAGNFAVDPFEGMTVLYNSALPAYDTADEAAVYAIVGDLKGMQINFPEGEGVVIKYDDTTEAENDLVKIVGRQYAAIEATAPFRFTNIKKPVTPVTT